MTGAQSLLAASDDLDADMGGVIAQALQPLKTGQGRFRVSGPAVRLSAKQAMTLALAINDPAGLRHELRKMMRHPGRDHPPES